MINQSLCTGIFPNKLKLATVIPLYKRVIIMFLTIITLLSNVSKIFEKSVYIQVYDYFCAHQFLWKPVWLQKMPFNWTCCASTSWSYIQTLWWWKIPVSDFLDLSNNFDSLNHAILMDKFKYYGLNETSLDWFRSYLYKRYQYTKSNGACSDVINLTTGVP